MLKIWFHLFLLALFSSRNQSPPLCPSAECIFCTDYFYDFSLNHWLLAIFTMMCLCVISFMFPVLGFIELLGFMSLYFALNLETTGHHFFKYIFLFPFFLLFFRKSKCMCIKPLKTVTHLTEAMILFPLFYFKFPRYLLQYLICC